MPSLGEALRNEIRQPVVAILLFAARDVAPTVAVDAATHAIIVSGLHHAYKPVINPVRTD